MIRSGGIDMDMFKSGAERAGYAAQVRSWLESIMFGKEDHKWAYVITGEGEN